MLSITSQLDEFIQKIRPPEELRAKLDIAYVQDNRNIFIVEIRPKWNEPEIILRYPVAKIRHVKSQDVFKLYYMRANGKWVPFPLQHESSDLTTLLEYVEDDPICCFWS